MGTNKNREFDADAANLIRFKARQLVGQYGYKSTDREDIEHDLIVDFLEREPRFDADRGHRLAFIRMVINRGVVSLIRKRTSASRDYRRSIQISVRDDGNDDVAGAFVCTDEDQRLRDLRSDLADALGTLAEDLRGFATQLSASRAPEVAGQNDLTRDEMRRIVRRIRQHFEAHGLRDYFPR